MQQLKKQFEALGFSGAELDHILNTFTLKEYAKNDFFVEEGKISKTLGFIEKKGDQVVRKYPNLKTTDNVMDLSIRKSHLSDLPLIEKSLLDVPLDLRDNISCTFVIDKKDITKAKELIRIFQSQFLNQMGKDVGEEVYKLTIALYPLTKVSPLIAGEVNAKKLSK